MGPYDNIQRANLKSKYGFMKKSFILENQAAIDVLF